MYREKRREKKRCDVCGQRVWHLDGRPWNSHLAGRRHRGIITVVVEVEGRLLKEQPAALRPRA